MRELTRRARTWTSRASTAAQFLAGAVPLVPLALLAGGSTDWSEPSLLAALAFLIVGGQVRRRVQRRARALAADASIAWTFLAPASAVVIEAARGNLPGAPPPPASCS